MNEEIKLFDGFHKETLFFFKELELNNNKKWFHSHRDIYEDHVINPARSFIVDMGERLKVLSPTIIGDPRVNKSLFRINRDVRFSKDKSPYKTNLGIVFWDGAIKKMEASSFYFHLEPDNLMLGAGIYKFSKSQLELYRELVVEKTKGKELADIYSDLVKKGYEFGGKNYKRVPKGYEVNQKMKEFLLFDGLYVSYSTKIPMDFYKKDFIEFCFNKYKEMSPLQEWLDELNSKL